jgi:hypothetical protein
MIDEDPAASVTRARMPKTGGFKTWSEEDLAQFEAAYPVGTKERLAMATGPQSTSSCGLRVKMDA